MALPSEVFNSVLSYLDNDCYHRLLLVSWSFQSLIIASVPRLKVQPPPKASEAGLSLWSKNIGAALQMSHLTKLSLPNFSTGAECLVKFAPRLLRLALAFPRAQGPPPDALWAAVKDHPTISKLRLSKLPKDVDMARLLPPTLRSLAVDSSRPRQLPPTLITQIVDSCPGITSLSLRESAVAFTDLTPLNRLHNLVKLYVSFPLPKTIIKTTTELERYVGKVAALFPPTPARQWKRLIIGPFNPNGLCHSLYSSIESLRKILAVGVRPDVEALFSRFQHSHDFCVASEETQLSYVRFLTEACGVRAEPCRCPPGLVCNECQWTALLPVYQPLAAQYLLERHFLPFLAGKAALTGADPAELASELLDNFCTPGQCEDTVIAYFNNLQYPLKVDYAPESHGLRPMFFGLYFGDLRNALVARARATNASLGLAFRDSAAKVAATSHHVLIHASAVEPRYFLFNLDLFVAASKADVTFQIAIECPLSRKERLECLQGIERGVAALTAPALALLAQALDLLLKPVDAAQYFKGLVLSHTVEDLRWFLGRGLGIDALRSATGGNFLHTHLRDILRTPSLESVTYDRELLVQIDTRSGNTPLHEICARWDGPDEAALAVASLQPLMQWINEQDLWEIRNLEGNRPLDQFRAKYVEGKIADPNLRSFLSSHL